MAWGWAPAWICWTARMRSCSRVLLSSLRPSLSRMAVSNLKTARLSSYLQSPWYVRINVLTPAGVLDRDKKLGAVREMTEIVTVAAGDPTLAERTWVLISEAPEGGWGIDGHAYLNAEIADTARRILGGG